MNGQDKGPEDPDTGGWRQGEGLAGIPLISPGTRVPEEPRDRKTSYTVTAPEEDEDSITLVHGKFEKLPMKDFGAEIRAFRDVENFMDSTLLLLDIEETGLQDIMDVLIRKVLDSKQDGAQFSQQEAMEALFTQDSVHVLAKTIQGTVISDESGFDFDQSWICAMCELPTVSTRHVVVGRLHHPANLGSTSQEVQFVILIVAPTKEKSTKTALETGRTFATIFSDLEFRYSLQEVQTEEDFKKLLRTRTKALIKEQSLPENRTSHLVLMTNPFDDNEKARCPLGQGMLADLKRRIPHYLSDFKDGIIGYKAPQKTTSTVFFLYFACVLPNIAFGMLNDNNTHGAIEVKKILFSQSVGGVLFAFFGGQPLIVLLTTAPLALYTKIIYSICEDFDLNFSAMFCCVGLWNCFFLLVYSFTNLSKLMQFSTRSTEEIFSLFITFAFSADAIKDTIKDFNEHYYSPACKTPPQQPDIYHNITNSTTPAMSTASNLSSPYEAGVPFDPCLKENSMLFLLLMLGTVWLGITFYNFTKTPFLTSGKREMLADYSLPAAVLIMSFFGSYIFRQVPLKPFKYNPDVALFVVAPVHTLPAAAVVAAAGLGFSLSLLFFMDQNISSALVNNPNNKLKKGAAYHWDLFVVAVINGFLSIFTLPWVHAALPHSPLHVKALADMEDRVEQGHVHQTVVRVRETRLTGIISHVLIGVSTFLLPYPMSYIPAAVLDGLFLYVALTALYGNQMFDRIILFITEQSAYPPNHYLRRVPQRKVHTFTVLQLLQLLVLCVFGFSPIPYMKMVFPVLIMFLMPIRHKLVSKVIEPKYLKALDWH